MVADQTGGGGGGGSSDASLVSYQYPNGLSRSVEQRLRDRVSVKDFGAKGDGTTDDYVAIQAAFDSVSASGETLYFPAGTYLISQTLKLKLLSTANPDQTGNKVECTQSTIIKAMNVSHFATQNMIEILVKDESRDQYICMGWWCH